MMKAPWISSLFIAFFLITSIATQPTANLLSTWTNDESFINSTSFTDGSKIRAILHTHDDNLPTFTCGFFCNGTCTSYIAYVESNPPQVYFLKLASRGIPNPGRARFVSDYIEFIDTILCLYVSSTEQSNICLTVDTGLPRTFTLKYIKLMPDGHLKAVGWDSTGDGAVTDIFTNDQCSYPLACGRNARWTDSFRTVDSI
ncbi:hypothetical protein L2E82_07973 [Cichorium intybus]|uniref:Uncharacterized protein n=1 Tax=Cichorium intybus TaxID=13427 RepID=A0ACB9G5A4_CICIN|nr:hypothetical protein L2E82_07973 [Cichorium intybus]